MREVSMRAQWREAQMIKVSTQEKSEDVLEVLLVVWRACEDNAATEVNRFAPIIREDLPDGSVTLKVTPLELRKFFQEAAPPPRRRGGC